MGKNVYANGMEVSAKAADNQSIAAMPDVCLSPPTPPAGPVPIPYPNFSQASDTANGTRTVKIGGDEVGQKDKSYYKTSKGDEAATRTLGMGTVTHTIQGKTYFAAWSMDVKFEDENAIRFGDLTTHNHMSQPMDSGCTTSSVADAAPSPTEKDCKVLDDENKKDRKSLGQPHADGGTNANGLLHQPPSEPELVAGHSWAGADTQSSKHKAGHSDRKPRKQGGTESNVSCEDNGNFRYRGPEGQTSGHAESRIIENTFANGGGTASGQLTLKIDWIKGSDPANPSCAPCASCHALMCAATKCGLKIFVCAKDNTPHEVKDCPDNLDMADEDAREEMNQHNKMFASILDAAPI